MKKFNKEKKDIIKHAKFEYCDGSSGLFFCVCMCACVCVDKMWNNHRRNVENSCV